MISSAELIANYLDDSLTEDQATQLDAWLRADTANLQEFVIATAREEQLRAAVVANEALNVVKERQDQQPEVPRRRFRVRTILKWTIAACLVVFVTWFATAKHKGASILTLVEASGPVSLQSKGDTTASQLNVGEKLSAGTLSVAGDGARAEFSYPDGSRVSLSGGSKLTLVNGPGKRLFLRRGALIATVARQPAGRPLLVHTSTAEAQVQGTSFGINAAEAETLLQVTSGSVKLRRLSDDQSLDVGVNEQVRAGQIDAQPLLVEPVSVLPTRWQANSAEIQDGTWLGEWNDDGVLVALPRSVYLKKTGVNEVHFHAGVYNRLQGLVMLGEDSAVRVRYRIRGDRNIGVFVVTHLPSWEFSGNFEAYFLHEQNPADADGWRTATVSLTSFIPRRSMAFRPGCHLSAIYLTTYEHELELEVAELEVVRTGDE